MAAFEDNTQVFIVRIWYEPRHTEQAPDEWRGVIEHVPSGERRYLKDLNHIIAFIIPYLKVIQTNISIMNKKTDLSGRIT